MPAHSPPPETPALQDDERLCEWIANQRWYASKSRSISSAAVVESIVLRDEPLLVLALVQTRFATGTHELYQLLATETEPDALSDGEPAFELVRRIAAGDEIDTAEGHFSFRAVDGFVEIDDGTPVRTMGVEQSNSSVVFDDRLVLKVLRKLEPGINPELEILRFLTQHGFPNIAALEGWYSYDGQPLAATLGVAPRAETGVHIQDASFHSQMFLPLPGDRHALIRFSNFGDMATVSDDEPVPEPTMAVVRELLARHGHVYVPAAVLAQPYTGSNPGVTGIDTWWIRYFDWV